MLANVFFFFSFFFPIFSPLLPWPRLSQQVSAQLPAQKNSLIYFGSTLIFLSDVTLSKIRVGIADLSPIPGFCLGTTACLQFISLKSAPFFWLPTSPGCTFAHTQASLRRISPQWSRLVPANRRRGIGPGNSAVIFCCDEKKNPSLPRMNADFCWF